MIILFLTLVFVVVGLFISNVKTSGEKQEPRLVLWVLGFFASAAGLHSQDL